MALRSDFLPTIAVASGDCSRVREKALSLCIVETPSGIQKLDRFKGI